MSSIVISGDTSGAITLAAPSVAGTNTATLPASTGTVMVSGNMPAFSVTASGVQTLTSGTSTKIQFNTKTGTNAFDTNSYFDAITNYRFTPLIAGYYQINATVQYQGSSNNGNVFNTYIFKNNTQYSQFQYATAATQYIMGTVSAIIYFNGSTDYIEVYAQHFQGSSQSVIGTDFSGCLVRAA